MQTVRLVMLTLVLLVLMVTFYISAKRSFLYLNFWALFLTFLGQFLLFWSSGTKIMDIMRIQKCIEKKIPVRRKRKSGMWKWAIALYMIAGPLAAAQAISFAFRLSND